MPLSQSSPSPARLVSLRAAISMLDLASSLVISAVRLCGLPELYLSRSVQTFDVARFRGVVLVGFLFVVS